MMRQIQRCVPESIRVVRNPVGREGFGTSSTAVPGHCDVSEVGGSRPFAYGWANPPFAYGFANRPFAYGFANRPFAE